MSHLYIKFIVTSQKKLSWAVIALPHRGREFCDFQKICFWLCLSYGWWWSSLGLLHELSSSSTGSKVYNLSHKKLSYLSYLAVSCTVILSIQASNTWAPKILLKKNIENLLLELHRYALQAPEPVLVFLDERDLNEVEAFLLTCPNVGEDYVLIVIPVIIWRENWYCQVERLAK